MAPWLTLAFGRKGTPLRRPLQTMPLARDQVEQWLLEKQSLLGVSPYSWVRSDQHAETFHACYETNVHLVQVSCWNHAWCLDIFALNKESGETDFSVAGPCDGREGLAERLSEFAHWLESR